MQQNMNKENIIKDCWNDRRTQLFFEFDHSIPVETNKQLHKISISVNVLVYISLKWETQSKAFIALFKKDRRNNGDIEIQSCFGRKYSTFISI